jgi:hypothetical protein
MNEEGLLPDRPALIFRAVALGANTLKLQTGLPPYINISWFFSFCFLKAPHCTQDALSIEDTFHHSHANKPSAIHRKQNIFHYMSGKG